MASYTSLRDELAELMREAALDVDAKGSHAGRTRRATSTGSADSAGSRISPSAMVGDQALTTQTAATYQFRPNTQIDNYGFPLPQSISLEHYKASMLKLEEETFIQTRRWSELTSGTGFPRSGKAKRAIRKGIPPDLRSPVWSFYSGATELRSKYGPSYYKDLALSIVPTRMFELEIGQTFVNNLSFGALLVDSGTEPGRQVKGRYALARVLLAYVQHFSADSIPGSLNVIASAFLLVTKDEESTFWLLLAHTARLGASFSSVRGRVCLAEQDVLFALLEEKEKKLVKHLRHCGIDSLQHITNIWTSSLFIEQLPFDSVLRVLDAYLHEGPKILLRVALALFKIHAQSLLLLSDPFKLRLAIKELPNRELDQSRLMETAFDRIGSMSSSKIESLRKKVLERFDAIPRPIDYDDGSLVIGLVSEEELEQSPPVTAPISLEIPLVKIIAPGSSSDALLSVSPPRFRKTSCQLNPAVLSPLAEEEDQQYS